MPAGNNAKLPTSGKRSRPVDGTGAWARRVAELCELVDIACVADLRPHQAGKPCILRMRERDDHGVPTGGAAVLTLYATGSWTWGGDADVVAYAREPLDVHGALT